MRAGAGREWRNYWTLPMAGALGNSLTVLHVYSLGAFMEPLHQEFGWNRAEVSLGITVSNGIASALGIGVGILVDRLGPRPVGILGAALMCMAIASLGTATGTLANWFVLWGFVALGASFVGPTIWTSAVASRFDASRGLAIAIVIAGAGLAATIIPPLTAWILENYGWRAGFYGLGLVWAVVVIPVLILFFRGAYDRRGGTPRPTGNAGSGAMPGLTLAEGLRSSAFYRLGLAGGLFAFVAIGLIVHFVPILTDSGLNLIAAGSITGLIGLSSILGRFGTGFLLDRFDAKLVAAVAFGLPTVSALLLLSGGGPAVLTAAALTLGLSLGSELDVIVYLATRHFGLKRYGVLFASMLVFLAVGMALGPVSAGAIYDHVGGYAPFLWLTIPLVLLASLLVGTLGPYPAHAEEPAPPETA